MLETRALALAATLVLASTVAHAKDTTAAMMSAEAAEEGAREIRDTITTSQSAATESSSGDGEGVAGSARGISRAALFDSEFTRGIPFSLNDFSMIMGPGFNSMSASAPTSSQPYSGVSARHELKLEYALRRNVNVTPTMDVTQYFYNNKQGRLVLNDPSLRVAIADVARARFNGASFGSSVWVQVYAPVSALSEQLDEYTALSLAYLPKLYFQGSRFFLSGVAEGKVNFMQNSSRTGMIAPAQLVGALQGNYRLSPKITAFLMNHASCSVGPNFSQLMLATPLGSENYRRKTQAQNAVTDSFMLGAMFQVVQGVSLSPRLDWTVENSIGTTTVGLNASFHVI